MSSAPKRQLNFTNALVYTTAEKPPARIYVHSSSHMPIQTQKPHVYASLDQFIEENPAPQQQGPKEMTYFFGILWENNNSQPMIDLLGFANSSWSGNHTVFSWVLQNGVYSPSWSGFTCEEGIILAGIEAINRKIFPNLHQYINSPFIIPDL